MPHFAETYLTLNLHLNTEPEPAVPVIAGFRDASVTPSWSANMLVTPHGGANASVTPYRGANELVTPYGVHIQMLQSPHIGVHIQMLQSPNPRVQMS